MSLYYLCYLSFGIWIQIWLDNILEHWSPKQQLSLEGTLPVDIDALRPS